jgi:hypothetical protein
MLKRFVLLFLSFMTFAACASGPASYDGELIEPPFFLSSPVENELVFLGVAGKRSNPKETQKFALEDAARRVAIFYRVSAEYAVENNIGSGTFDYSHSTYSFLNYDKEGAQRYVDSLKFDADKKSDSMEIENVLIIRTRYPLTFLDPIRYQPTYDGKERRPDWVDKPAVEIEGYEVGIGYSGRYSSMAETWVNSYNNAIFSIIRNVNTSSRSEETIYQSTGSLFGYRTSNENITYSYGTLTGFYVLDAWMDPRTKSVWTLAIARKTQ